MPNVSKDKVIYPVRNKISRVTPTHSVRISNGVYRVIDANINRLKEGLRVCEEITRFILNSRAFTSEFKKIRHRTDAILRCFPGHMALFQERESLRDVGGRIYGNELKRKSYQDIFFANIQRAKESVRVLEEFTKLIDKNIAVKLKRLRYDLYELEKKVAQRIPPLCNRR